MNKVTERWRKTGLLHSIEPENKEVCSFVLEESYQFLKERDHVDSKVDDLFFQVVLRLFEFVEEYVNINYLDLYNTILDVKKEVQIEDYLFEDTAIIHTSFERFKSEL